MSTNTPNSADRKLPVQPTPPDAQSFPPTLCSAVPMVFVLHRGSGEDFYNSADTCLYVIDAGQPLSSLATNSSLQPLDARMHVRGISTRYDVKPQYAVHLKQTPTDQRFISLPFSGHHWVFNDAGVVDTTLLRNPLAFEMQRRVPGAGWAPHTDWFELFVCTTERCPELWQAPVAQEGKQQKGKWRLDKVVNCAAACYQGLYINMEKVEPGSDRVPVVPYRSDQPASGVADLLLQVNHEDSKYRSLNTAVPPTLPSLGMNQLVVCEPDARYFQPPANGEQWAAIERWWQNWGSLTAFAADWEHTSGDIPVPRKGYADTTQRPDPFNSADTTAVSLSVLLQRYIDFDSFAAYLLLAEIAKDPDGYHRSTFMYKKGERVYAGPLWDKNKSYGNSQNTPGSWYVETTGWTLLGAGNPLISDSSLINPCNPAQCPDWWRVLLTSRTFCDTVWRVWNEACCSTQTDEPPLAYTTLAGQLAGWGSLLNEQQQGSSPLARDLSLWRGETSPDSWQEACKELNSYLKARLSWIDSNLENLLKDCSGVTLPSG